MKLQFTNGYRPRFDQISRILQYLHSQEGGKKNSRIEIVTSLGIPERQVDNLTSMMVGFGLVFPRVTTLTPFGKAIVLSDPYFDKIETLWIVHHIVSSEPEWVVWYRIINTVLLSGDRFEVDEIVEQYFSDLAQQFSERTFSEKLPTEVGAVFAAYTRSELSRLQIIKVEGTGKFIKSDPVDIPDLAFLFCLLYYRDKSSPGSSAVNVADICLKENSPGRVLHLEEYQVRTILGNLHDAGLVSLEQFANLDQVRFSGEMSQENVLQRIYRGV
ncbi:MAG: DUF4007 family protein [Leptolinea sp.]